MLVAQLGDAFLTDGPDLLEGEVGKFGISIHPLFEKSLVYLNLVVGDLRGIDFFFMEKGPDWGTALKPSGRARDIDASVICSEIAVRFKQIGKAVFLQRGSDPRSVGPSHLVDTKN
jgi:hypothetical protein